MPDVPMTSARLDEISARHANFEQRHKHTAFRCCSAHDAADAVPELVAEVRRARAAEAEAHEHVAEAATEIEWLVNKLSEHASYEDAEADARDLVARLRGLAAKEA